VKNLQRPHTVDLSKSPLLAFTRAFRLPPDVLTTWAECVLAIVLVGLFVALLVDIGVRWF